MIKNATLLVLSLLSSQVYGQGNFEYISDQEYVQFAAMDIWQDHTVMVGKRGTCSQPYLEVINGSGHFSAAWTPYSCASCSLTDVIWHAADTITILGFYNLSDDVSFDEDGLWLMQVDPQGNLHRQLKIDSLPGYSQDTRLRRWADGTFSITHQNYFIRVDKDLELFTVHEYDLGFSVYHFSDHALLNDTTLLLLGWTGLMVGTTTGEILDTLATAGSVSSELSIHGDTAYFSAGGKDHRFSVEGGLESEPATEFFGYFWSGGQRFAYSNSEIYSQEEGVWEPVWSTDALHRSIVSVKSRDDHFSILGLESAEGNAYNAYQAGYLSKLESLFLTPGLAGHDVQILEVELADVSYVENPQAPGVFTVNGSFEMRMSNKGDEALSFLVIGSQYIDGFNCLHYRALKSLNNLLVQPGEDFSANLAISYVRTADSPAELAFMEDICFFAIAPNHQLDADMVDNTSCAAFIFTKTNEIKAEADCRVFPNPAWHTLTLQWEEELSPASVQLYLINAQGQRVLQQMADSAGSTELNVSGLPAGIYWLTAQGEGSRMVKKVIIQ